MINNTPPQNGNMRNGMDLRANNAAPPPRNNNGAMPTTTFSGAGVTNKDKQMNEAASTLRKYNLKCIRLATVIGYIFCVSLVSIVLGLYYNFGWVYAPTNCTSPNPPDLCPDISGSSESGFGSGYLFNLVLCVLFAVFGDFWWRRG